MKPQDGGPNARRPSSLRARLVRAGFADPERARVLVADPDLVPQMRDVPIGVLEEVLDALGRVASPDDALLALTRLAAIDEPYRSQARAVVLEPGVARDRLLAVLGASTALADHLVRHPEDLAALAEPDAFRASGDEVRSELLEAVGADPQAAVPVAVVAAGRSVRDGVDAMRRAYRRRLLQIAAADLTHPDPLSIMPAVGSALADLAASALEAGLALARAEVDDGGRAARLAVIGMGKTGGRELNYVSDVDVIYVAEAADGVAEDEALRVAAALAAGLTRACSAPAGEPTLWPVDAALRPEGKNGPLVRTVASHLAYYQRWAKTWEFQALLKARVVAGDAQVGQAYLEAVSPLVWAAVGRENFVEDSQAMRRRVEDHVPPSEAERQIKLGPGGLRDVEFTVQLLQLVHGRADGSIRSSQTLTALDSLAAGGYVGRDHAGRLAACYRQLRVFEHRVQLHRLRRTHLMPVNEQDLRRLARSTGLGDAAKVGEQWRTVRRDVRHLHEELFYRPLLPATASLSQEEASLSPQAAKARLAAIGYRDPDGALRHIQALTEGVTRRAAIQRQLLPVLLGWFADGADSDAGLLAFRRLSDELGGTHWYLKLLRDSGVAAQRLAVVLSTSRYAAEAIGRSPESVRWLDDDADITTRDESRLWAEADAFLARRDDTQEAITLLRALRRRESARVAVGEVLGNVDVLSGAGALTAAVDVALRGALRVAEWDAAHGESGLLTRMCIVAMGRLGGWETGYGSDADVMFVHDPVAGADPEAAQAQANAMAQRVGALLGAVGPEPALEVDADLRPEGRNGPLARTLASYAEYYARWSAPWESQALLRARPVAGDEDVAARFVAMIDPIRYPKGGASPEVVLQIRRLKARMEAERLPRGIEPSRHLKLGRGGLSDVEWTAQLLQLQHAHRVPGLRTTETVTALGAAAEAGLLSDDDYAQLRETWLFASRLRNAIVLWTGRTSGSRIDVLPHDLPSLAGLARLVGLGRGAGAELEDTYLREARRARAVVERVFYG